MHRIQAWFRGRRARSKVQLIDPDSLGLVRKALDHVALFAQIPQLTKQRLLTKLRRKRFPASEPIVREDEVGDSFYIIEAGVSFKTLPECLSRSLGLILIDRLLWQVATVWVEGDQVHRMGQWGTFGEMALVDPDYVNSATIRAETSVVVLRMGRADFFTVMKSFEEDLAAEEQGKLGQ